jgi:hypothetical protein
MLRSRTRPETVFRRQAFERFAAEIERGLERNSAAGRLPFEGAWRPPDEIRALNAEMKKRDRRIFAELLGLFALLAGTIGAIDLLMLVVLPW